MKKALFIFFILTSIISCKESKVNNNKAVPKIEDSIITQPNLPVDKISFDFKAKRDRKENGFIKVKATLFNADADTAYFLTWTCEGLIYDFVYDTAKLSLFPRIGCNASYPEVEKIAPHSHLDFDAEFVLRKPANKIKLSYDFYRVEKGFDTKQDIHQVIKYQENKQKTILYTGEKLIE